MTIRIFEADQGDREYIEEQIVEYNRNHVPFTQNVDFIRLDYKLIHEASECVGGITAVLYCWNCLFIDVLWVDSRFRSQGLGAKLLETVESKAKEMSCRLAHLDTFDFQAKDFYIKNGYEIFGILDNCPEGYQRYYLKKNLSLIPSSTSGGGGKKA